MIGVYISIPFCSQKCTYCNFASGVFPAGLLDQYLEALEAEMASESWSQTPDTLYLGGGTPSLLDGRALERLLGRLPHAGWMEATLEAAPGTITPERVSSWQRLGFDRASLGVQSFVDRELRATGRRHSAAEVAAEVDLLRRQGIQKINIDLIAGLPYQTPQSWRASLEWIERLAPPHVSVYMLEIDQDSRLGREKQAGGARYGAPVTPSEDETADLYLEAVDRLERLGLARYEISNFARPGFESLHNLKYWRLEPYRGFGADAHSYDGSRRRANVETAAEYVERHRAGRSPLAEIETSKPAEERFFLGLRQTAGIEPGPDEWERHREPIQRLSQEGLLERDGPRLRLTGRGVLLSNLVFEEFLA